MNVLQENMRDDDPFSGEFQRLERLACDTIQVNYNRYILSLTIYTYKCYIFYMYFIFHIYMCHNTYYHNMFIYTFTYYMNFIKYHNPEKNGDCRAAGQSEKEQVNYLWKCPSFDFENLIFLFFFLFSILNCNWKLSHFWELDFFPSSFSFFNYLWKYPSFEIFIFVFFFLFSILNCNWKLSHFWEFDFFPHLFLP